MQTARYTGFRLRRFDCGTFEAHYQVGQETVHCSDGKRRHSRNAEKESGKGVYPSSAKR